MLVRGAIDNVIVSIVYPENRSVGKGGTDLALMLTIISSDLLHLLTLP